MLLGVATNDPGAAAPRASDEVTEHSMVIIKPISYAEASIGYTPIEAPDAALPGASYKPDPLAWAGRVPVAKSKCR